MSDTFSVDIQSQDGESAARQLLHPLDNEFPYQGVVGSRELLRFTMYRLVKCSCKRHVSQVSKFIRVLVHRVGFDFCLLVGVLLLVNLLTSISLTRMFGRVFMGESHPLMVNNEHSENLKG